MQMVIDTGELDAFAQRYAGATAVIERECLRAMTETAIFIESRAKEGTPIDLGRLRQSIQYEVNPFEGVVRAGSDGLTYAATMEEGRRPGAPMPPAGSMLPWMQRHGIDSRLEYVIRRSIARNGIVGKHFMRQAAEAAQAGPAQKYFSLAIGRATRALGGR